MDIAIERLILQKRKECYSLLVRNKEIKAAAWFFVDGGKGLTDIMIPGVEPYFDSPEGKRSLQNFFAAKWWQYKDKIPHKLMAVVIMSDMWYVKAERPDDIPHDEFINDNKGMVPSDHPDRRQCIGFVVHSVTERKFYLYEYKKAGRHFSWSEIIEDVEQDLFGNMGDLYPR
jgi:hypothetical protein